MTSLNNAWCIVTRGILATCMYCIFLSHTARSEDDKKPTKLGIKQEGIAAEMANLEQKLLHLIQELQKTEPEQAEKLSKTFELAKSKLIEKRMSDIVDMLNQSDLDDAEERQQKVIIDLSRILEELLKETDEYDLLAERIKQLEEWKAKVAELEAEERRQQRESEMMADKEKAIADLEKMIKDLKSLLSAQKQLNNDTDASVKKGDQDLEKLIERQEELKNKTGEMQKELKDTPMADHGAKELGEASDMQQSAQEKMASGKPKSASNDQKSAAQKMDDAIKALEKEKDRLENLPKDQNQKMAETQEETRKKTDQLAKEMSKAEAGAESEPSPGMENMEQAEQSMSQASQSQQKSESGKASKQQKKAADELEKAKKELEKEIAKAKEEQQAELLVKLEEIFKEMLRKQEIVSAATVDLEKLRSKWTRAEDLLVAKLTTKEAELKGTADGALKLMEEDGTPTVFPGVTRILINELEAVTSLMKNGKTGDHTQLKQKNIERILKDLLAALEEAQENPPQEPQEPQEPKEPQDKPPSDKPPSPPPLVSMLSEFKLLRILQARVNEQTVTLNKADTMRNDIRKAESKAVSDQQKEIYKMTDELIKKAEQAQGGGQ